jgi:hypothetical protein
VSPQPAWGAPQPALTPAQAHGLRGAHRNLCSGRGDRRQIAVPTEPSPGACSARRRSRPRSSRRRWRSPPGQKSCCSARYRGPRGGTRWVRSAPPLRSPAPTSPGRLPAGQASGRPPQSEEDLVATIKVTIRSLPTYGYHRMPAFPVLQARERGRAPPNYKRGYRVMKAHRLLLQQHAGGAEQRRHDGRVVMERSNLRWCSDGPGQPDPRCPDGFGEPAVIV